MRWRDAGAGLQISVSVSKMISVFEPIPSLRGGSAFLTEACVPPILGDPKFVELLKKVRNFNYKTNDASVSKIDLKIFNNTLYSVDC